jgi:hypothetical protein
LHEEPVRSEQVYRGGFLDVRRDEVRLPDGGLASREYIVHPGAVMIVPILASVGSVSPYVGLFGTVWGIMSAFIGLSNVQQASLASVAPGIAEALVATAIGLFAAIPAVIAYNRFARQIDRIAMQFETFIEEFSNILQRNIAHTAPGAP